MKNFYFTYGSNPQFPFSYGCSRVVANDKHEACMIFRTYHHDVNGAINCAFIYTEEQFNKAKTRCSSSFSFEHEVLEANHEI